MILVQRVKLKVVNLCLIIMIDFLTLGMLFLRRSNLRAHPLKLIAVACNIGLKLRPHIQLVQNPDDIFHRVLEFHRVGVFINILADGLLHSRNTCVD